MPEAAYFHIPFCVNICHYCDFNKVFLKGQPVNEYLTYMEKEMINTVRQTPYSRMKTIFVGGGTPTALDYEQFETFLKMVNRHFSFDELDEFTVEANPEQTDRKKLEIMEAYGVNRLSIGVQAFQEQLLKELGRTHVKEDVIRTVSEAKAVGIENISLDIMFGLPHQTVDMLKETLEIAFSLNVPHFSAYSLQLEKKTVFYNRAVKGDLLLPEQEEEAQMYEVLMEQMEKHGYVQYEISNFARPGYESKHNLQYWDNNEYYGIGAGAHSYVNGKRMANAGPLKKYMSLIDETGFPYVHSETLAPSAKMEEELFMGLRKMDGVSDTRFKQRYGKSMYEVFGPQIEQLLAKGWLKKSGDRVSLTKDGTFLGNEVFQEFIGVV
ncbi:radical SAM family heme chaperone HemW [Fictibacillus sp. WQ 8-8]|uniref:radical SAM family heme chaperone HemW n=1 Tax=Fictibacillus sp. WQ 8-8 TaxID=2938788 RepID=UPI00210ED482|nr:radical SAM family heme chaperone HemW [Fictibacillus sp. WQ 8-8]MCQ6266285.1 radical SAM family heme chaperone HemW [Fictibacillus sp. WQ 8-8]